MTTQVKFCPRCKFAASLPEKVCARCGHQFRTQFAPPAEPTQMIQAVAPSPAPAPAPAPSPAPAPPPAANVVSAILNECAAQYRRYTFWRLICWLSLPTVISLIMLFQIDRAEMALRERIASMGLDAEAWERSLRPQRRRTFAWTLGGFAAVIMAFLLMGALLSYVRSVQHVRGEEEAPSRSERAIYWGNDFR